MLKTHILDIKVQSGGSKSVNHIQVLRDQIYSKRIIYKLKIESLSKQVVRRIIYNKNKIYQNLNHPLRKVLVIFKNQQL